jgi:iron(III) transport system ATP-binding protein
MAQISIERLAVSYGGARVIDDLSLTIENGSLFTLLGPSGCGKTTLLRTIAGFLAIERGTVRFGDRDVTDVPAHRRDIGMVFQDYALFPDRSVFENVAYGLRARRLDGSTIRRRVGEYLERVGLNAYADRRPAALSGGQRQRVALARALVIEPQVLLMDEPLSNLDAKLRVKVREIISDLQREARITTVFVTHDQEEALALSDKLGLMRNGHIEQIGTPQEIYERPVSSYVADFVGGANVVPVECRSPPGGGAFAAFTMEGVPVEAVAPTLVKAGPALLVIRPENIALSRASGGTPGIAGRVRRKLYLGHKTSYRVELTSGRLISVDLQGSQHHVFAEGDRVAITFAADRALVVPS